MALSSVIGFDAALSQPNFQGLITLSGAYTLDLDNVNQNVIALDPGGASRNVTLFAEAATPGLVVDIVNMADAAENLVVKNAAGDTVVTIGQGYRCTLANVAGTWVSLGKWAVTL
jgi:hypothetical protein